MNERQRLLKIVKQYYSEGNVQLSSGKASNFYVDGKMITLSAEGAHLIAQVLKPELLEDKITAVGGLMIGADPMAAVISAASYSWDQKISAFIVRKEQKNHGKLKEIEGPLNSNDTVALIDDVITTAGSVLQAADRVEKTGANIKSVYALVDRMEGGKQNIEARGYSFKPIFTVKDLQSL